MVLRCLGLTVLKKLFLKWVGKWWFAILLNACKDRDLSLSCTCVCILPAAWTGLGKAKIMAHLKNENDIFLKNSSADVWFWGLWSSWISLWNTDRSKFYSAICQSAYWKGVNLPCEISTSLCRCDLWIYSMKYLCVCCGFWVADGKKNPLCATWQARSVSGRLPPQPCRRYPGLFLKNIGVECQTNNFWTFE